MVVKIDQSDCAIGGYLNLLDNLIDKISTRHVFMLAMLFSRTELTLLLQVLHICMLFMFHITCTPAHINIHGISIGYILRCRFLHDLHDRGRSNNVSSVRENNMANIKTCLVDILSGYLRDLDNLLLHNLIGQF